MYSAFIQSTNFLHNLPSSDPKKYIPVVLQTGNVHLPHLIVGHCAVWQFHVDVPRRIGHDHSEFAKNGHVKLPNVALYPLQDKIAPVSKIQQ